MKKIKNKIIMYLVMLIVSVIGIALSVIYDVSFGIGFFSSILGFSGVWLMKLSSISKDEKASKEYIIEENDERTKLIANEARSISFIIVLFLVLSMSFVGYFTKNDTMLFMSVGIVMVAAIVFFTTFSIINKKK